MSLLKNGCKTMRLLILSIFAWVILSAPTNIYKLPTLEPTIATCKGENPCRACSNCKYCKLCNSGCKCGVCSNSRNPLTEKPTSTKENNSSKVQQTSQYTGTTQKGLRCKRMVSGGGRCWQHK